MMIASCFETSYITQTSRTAGDSVQVSQQTTAVQGFFGHLYWTAAESMPAQLLVSVKVVSLGCFN